MEVNSDSGNDLASVDLLLARLKPAAKRPSLIDSGEYLWRAKDSVVASSRVPWVPTFVEFGQDDDVPRSPPTGSNPSAASPKGRVKLAALRGQKMGCSELPTAAGVTLAARRRAGPGPVSSPFDDGDKSPAKASPSAWFTGQAGGSGVGSMIEGGAGDAARSKQPSSRTALTLRDLRCDDVSSPRNMGQGHDNDGVSVFDRRGGRDFVRGSGVSQTVKRWAKPMPTSNQSDGHIDEFHSPNLQATSLSSGNTPNLVDESGVESTEGTPSSMTHTSWRSSCGSTASTVCANESPNAGHSSEAKAIEGLDELLDHLVDGCQEPDEVVNLFHPNNVSSLLSLRLGHSFPPPSFVNIDDPLVSDPAKSLGNAGDARMDQRKSEDKVQATGLDSVIQADDDGPKEDVSSIYDSICESIAAAQARRMVAGKGPREGEGVEGGEAGAHVHRDEMVL